MTPRIRSIKPAFWADQTIQRQELGVRLTFIGLWSHADDAGRIEGDPVLLRSRIHPCDPKVTQGAFNKWLATLEDLGRIQRYEVAGFPYILVPNFLKHQRINKPSESQIPPPPFTE